MNQTYYLAHETQYQFLHENGFNGWGGEVLERRMQGWNNTVSALLESSLFPNNQSEILELGSGAGDSLMPFLRRGYTATGIEISPTAVAWALEKFKKDGFEVSLIEANIANPLPLVNSKFGAVIDSACLHCLTEEDRKLAFKEVYRVLKPSGFFLVSHMVNDPRELPPNTDFNKKTRTQEMNGVHYRSMPTMHSLIDELIFAGFKIIKQVVAQNSWWDHANVWCIKTGHFDE